MNWTPLSPILYAKILGGSGGGSVTPGSIVTATGQMTDEQAAATRENIGAVSIDEIGTVFTLKGGVATVADLPSTGNSVGDVYYVEAVSAGYIWLTSATQPNGYWEELGETIDLSAYQLKPVESQQTGSTVTITPEANAIYKCGELTSLTISNPPATGKYAIIFFSGATATVVTGIDNFTVEANKRYRINVQDGYATFDSWPYTPV